MENSVRVGKDTSTVRLKIDLIHVHLKETMDSSLVGPSYLLGFFDLEVCYGLRIDYGLHYQCYVVKELKRHRGHNQYINVGVREVQ